MSSPFLRRVRKRAMLFVPPIIPMAIKALGSADQVFSGDKDLIQNCLATTKLYGEYGVGESTIYVHRHSSAQIISVDTSRQWVDSIVEKLADSAGRAKIQWVDLGPVANWGRPKGYARIERFGDYFNALWQDGRQPDTILVDGRFRVACFLTSLLRSPTGTQIIFDDYVNREHYKIVETILKPEVLTVRQALFRVPADFDRSAAQDLLSKFTCVME